MALFDNDALPMKSNGNTPVTQPSNTPVGSVDPKLKAMAEAQIEQARFFGWADRTEELYYAVGTRPMDGALEASRLEWEKRPPFEALASTLISKVKAENRHDTVVKVPDLIMLGDGRIESRIKQKPVALEKRGLEGLLRHVDGLSSGVAYLVDRCPPALRATNVNHFLPLDFRQSRGGKHIPHEVKLRLRNGDGKGYKVWGVVGKDFPTVDVDELAALMQSEIDPGARGEIKYDGYRASMTAIWHTTDEKIGVGGFLRAGLRLTTADDGTNAFDISAVLEQARCINLSVVPQVQRKGHFAHRGAQVDLRDKVRNAITQAKASIAPFVKAWSEAEQIGIESLSDPQECFTRLVERGYVKVSGIERGELVDRLVKAYQFDKGQSKTAVINAVTRAAHTFSWKSKWAQEELETQAGQMVYTRLNLAA